jgi:hypothetical protein
MFALILCGLFGRGALAFMGSWSSAWSAAELKIGTADVRSR